MGDVTTCGSFVVEDVTFTPDRVQSDILKEGVTDPGSMGDVSSVPVSNTLEQRIKFFLSKAEKTKDGREKEIYESTALDLLEYQRLRVSSLLREIKDSKSNPDISDDIGEVDSSVEKKV